MIEETLNPTHTQTQFSELGLAVIDIEIQALQALKLKIDQNFNKACRIILQCQGRVIVTGMGKSGHIGKKIAATLASTGTPAFFVHPAEASHGDLGMLTHKDVVISLSNSGTTDEILTILPLIKRLNVPLISLLGQPQSPLGLASTVSLDVSVPQEACPLGLAPTASTTAALVLGDALAIALLQARGFTAEDFARSHPSGRLGRRLLLQVKDLMHTGNAVPRVTEQTVIADALIEMTQKGLGLTTVFNEQHSLSGLFTDGDLRRTLDHNYDIHTHILRDVMTKTFKTLPANALAVDAVQLMEQYKITSLIIVNNTDEQRFAGLLHMHDLLRAKVI